MIFKWITLFLIVGSGVSAAPSEPALKLADQMQSAILEAQSVAKVEALLQQGVDVNAPIGCGTYSPLDGAIDRQKVDLLKFLLIPAPACWRQCARD